MAFRNQSNYKGAQSEKFTLPSLTVPDMAISLRTMLDRHLHGDKVAMFHPVHVTDDDMIPANFERMSKVERAAMARDVGDFIATTRGRIQSAKQASDAEKHRLVVEAEAEKLLASRASASAD